MVKKEEKKKPEKKLNKWQLHVKKTYADMKKKNPKVKFSQALKEAKKTYKK